MYNVHDIINKYTLPVIRDNQPIPAFLQQYYEQFIKDLDETVAKGFPNDFPDFFYEALSKKFLPVIKSECEMILDILNLDQKNRQALKRKRFVELMRMLMNEKAFRKLSIDEKGLMSRIRSGNGVYDRKNLFHVPFTQRQFSSSQRFSIPGNPCLYLAVFSGLKLSMGEMFELAWMESGMPKVFHACLFETQKELVFLHLAKKGKTYLHEYENASTEEQKMDRLEAVAQYLLTFPMRAACFIGIEDKHTQKNVRFYEEYVFPQLLMEWIQRSEEFDGVAYQSASSIAGMGVKNSYNVAMPVNDIDPSDGYDSNLKKYFKLSLPEKINLEKDIRKYEDDIKEVSIYTKELEEKLMMSNASMLHPYYTLLSVSRSLCSIYSEMKNGNEDNMIIPFQRLHTLSHAVAFISRTIEQVQTADEWITLHKRYDEDIPLAEDDYVEVLKKFRIVNFAIMNLKSVFQMNKFNKYAFEKLDFEFI